MSACFEMADKRSWLVESRARATRARVPMSAGLELTRRCNLHCRHCYLGNQTRMVDVQERDTESVIRSLDEWAEAGVLFLMITGGDPMMRRDFSVIYRHAVEQGMLVTVFCNGTLVTEQMVNLFRELPPRKVEITLYGATAETYETVTRIPGSHTLAWQGIRQLHDHGIRVALKTILLTLNAHELEAMAAQAEEMACEFRFDAGVFPRRPDTADSRAVSRGSHHGDEHDDPNPVDLRIPPALAVANDLATAERRKKWADSIRQARSQPETDRLYPCAAGGSFFHVDPYGNYSPCLMTAHYLYPARGRAFRDIWREDLAQIRNRKRTRAHTWLTGAIRGACAHCPGFNHLETGDEEIDSDYMKQTARLRYEAVRATTEGGDL